MTKLLDKQPKTDIPAVQGVTKSHSITLRSILLSVLLIVAVDYWHVQLEVVRYSFPTYAVPFYTVIFVLFALTAANAVLRRGLPKAALSSGEMMVVYVMLSVACAVCSTNMMQILVSAMGYATRYATPENGWHLGFERDLPTWLVVKDRTSLANLYSGNSSLYAPENYGPWVVPVLCWSAFCFVLLATMLFINCILRKHWTESERLTFPIIALPLEMMSEGTGFWRNPLMWTGFAIAGSITLLNGLHYLYPSIPALPIRREDMGQYFVNPPWNALAGTQKSFYFFGIGLSFLMPWDLSFSCWVFFLLYKLELVLSAAQGWNETRIIGGGFDRAFPCQNSQAFGAYMAVLAMTIWSARHYLKDVFRTAFTNSKCIDESAEPVSYREAILGAGCGLLLLGAFALRLGMSVWVVGVFFVTYFALAIMVARIRAEFGFPVHDMHAMQPQNLLQTIAPTEALGKDNLAGFSLFFWFNRTYASHPMPHQFEGFKVAERTRTPARQMFRVMLLASAIAMPIGFWMLLHNYFHYGAGTAKMEKWALGFGQQTWGNLDSWLKQPVPTNWTSILFVIGGFSFAMFLGWMRLRFLWFPFHPLAYAVADSWGLAQLWLPLMIGSTAKFAILRFGGLASYRRFLPFFFGLVLGEIIVGGGWTLAGIMLGIRTYDFWP